MDETQRKNLTGFAADACFTGSVHGDELNMRVDYFKHAHDLAALVKTAKARLAKVNYDTMVGVGLSGSLVVPRLAEALGKKWLVLRKEATPHSVVAGAGDLGRRWLFVDDQVSTGATRRRARAIIEVMCQVNNFKSQYAGTYKYEGSGVFDPNGAPQ